MTALIAIFTSRLAGPISSAFALLFLILALSQCAAKSAATHRADRAELALVKSEKDLTQCQDNRMALEGAIDTQNAALADLSREASIRTAAVEKAVNDALRGRESAEARAAKLLRNPPSGIDACARAMSAFDAVRESAR